MIRAVLIFGASILIHVKSFAQDSSIIKLINKPIPFDSVRRAKSVYPMGIVPNSRSLNAGDSSNIIGNTNDNGAADALPVPVVEPSPNSTAMVNLISDNVDLYTGVGGVNLPLYNLKCNSIELPISLQGSLNAHKVNEIGSSTGLGWSLNAGGAISRVMKNLPDEFTGQISPSFQMQGYGFTKILSQTGYLSNFENLDQSIQRPIIEKGNWNVRYNFPDKAYDLQPDEFYFHFGNYSGKFVFDQDGNINLIPQANFKITPSYSVINDNNKITGFTITTDNGFVYLFGNYTLNAVEESKLITKSRSIVYTYRAVAPSGLDPCLNDGDDWDDYYHWVDPVTAKPCVLYERYPYVLGDLPPIGGSIVPDIPAGNTKNFDFPDNIEDAVYCSYPSTWYLTKIISPTTDFINFSYNDNGTISYLSNRSFNASIPNLSEKYFTENNGTIDLLFVAPNISLQPIRDAPRKLYRLPVNHIFTVSTSTIELKSKKLSSITSSEGTSIFFYSNTPRMDFPGDKRLDYITVLNNQSNGVKTINLDYDDQFNSEELEDFRFSYYRTNYHYKVDQAGFYHQACTNGIYTEEIRKQDFAVPDYCRHRLFLKSIKETNGYGANLPPYLIEYDNSFLLPYRSSTEQDIFGFANENLSRNPFVGISYNSVLLNSSPQTSAPLIYFQTTNNGATLNWPVSSQQGNKNNSLNKMMAGVITKITYPTGGFKKYEYDFNGDANAWNGLRVKEIKEFESLFSLDPVNRKQYSFGTFFPNDIPIINYGMEESLYQPFSPPNLIVMDGRRIFLSSGRVNSENLTKGQAGGYTFGEVRQTNNGKQRVTFYTSDDNSDIQNTTNISSGCLGNSLVLHELLTFPFPEKSSFDWMRGLPKMEQIKSETGADLKITTYNYDFIADYGVKEITGLSVAKYNILGFGYCNSVAFYAWHMALYGKTTYTSKWVTNASKVEQIYDQAGSNFLENSTDYTYTKYTFNNKDYLYPRIIRDVKNSHNNVTLTNIKYPLDYPLGPIIPPSNDEFILGIKKLLNTNVLNVPVEKYVYQVDPNNIANRKYLSGIVSKYYPTMPLLKEIYKLKTNGLVNSPFTESYSSNGVFHFDPNYKSEVQFPTYDFGHIVQQNKTDNISEAYIWDYGKMYPVAKTVNAKFNEIAYTSFEGDGFGNWEFNHNLIVNNSGFSGRKSIHLVSNTDIIQNSYELDFQKKFTLSFWARGQNPYVSKISQNGVSTGISYSPKKMIGGWSYFEITIANAITVKLSGGDLIDELRLYPFDAFMTTYTFDPLKGMTGEIDAAGKQTYYEYDALNRLSIVRDQNTDITKTVCYNYASQPVPCATNVCPAPVITSAIRNNNTSLSLSFTSPANSSNCRIRITDIDEQIVWFVNPDGCDSPRDNIVLPNQIHPHHYKIEVVSYSVQCPNGTWSVPVEI